MPDIGHRESEVGNMDEQKLSPPIGGKGGSDGEGSNDPADLKTELVFFRFFHLARRFWNHTYK